MRYLIDVAILMHTKAHICEKTEHDALARQDDDGTRPSRTPVLLLEDPQPLEETTGETPRRTPRKDPAGGTSPRNGTP